MLSSVAIPFRKQLIKDGTGRMMDEFLREGTNLVISLLKKEMKSF